MATAKRKFKMKVKPVGMDAKAAQEVWGSLKAAFQQVYEHNESQLSFEELYRFAYNLVLHRHGAMLYDGVKTTVGDNVTMVSAVVAEAHDDGLLQTLNDQWEDHKVILKSIHDILMYMDRTYVQQNKKKSIYEVGLLLFRDKVVRHSRVRSRLRSLLLVSIDRERRGELIDVELMRSTLAMLVDLENQHKAEHGGTPPVYERDFEREFLAATRTFYTQEALEFLTRSTCPDYLQKAERRITEERERVQNYLHSSTAPKLRLIVETLLITNNAEALVAMDGSGAETMFRENRAVDLARMYRLFSMVPSTLEVLRRAMRALVTTDGKALVTDQERAKVPVEFVQKLLDMRDKYTTLIDRAFGGDKDFHGELRESFEHFLNLDARCAQFLSMYVDDAMRHSFKGRTEEEIDSVLTKVVIIFRYLRDKDVFESFYKSHLQKRLLGNRSLSSEAERSMITKLKTECGFQFTSKLEGMFNDLAISRDLMATYRVERDTSIPVEVHATVLTSGFWPVEAVPPCTLPPVVTTCAEQFRAFYLSKHTGRRLTWQTNQGTAELRALYTAKRHDFTVSTYQLCILMQYNDADTDELSFKALADGTKIPVDEMKRHLLSLTTPRHRIIVKMRKGKEIGDDDRFKLNREYTSPMIRVKVPLVSMRSAVPTSGATAVPAPVEEDRRHAIEAAIVRIMKSRRTLDHSRLVAEVTTQLARRFQPTPQAIKKRIESLIEREYLERDSEDRRTYNYLA